MKKHWLLFGLSALLIGGLVGCRATPESSSGVPADSVQVSGVDSVEQVLPDTAQQSLTDTLAADALPESPVVPPAPVRVDTPATAVDLTPLVAVLDSLRREVGQLQTAVADLREANQRAAADTAQAVAVDSLDTVDRLKDRAEDVRNISLLIVEAILVLVVAVFFVRGIIWLLDNFAERSAAQRLFYKRLIPVVRLVTYITAAYIIVAVIFDVGGDKLLAASAALGVAIGFAAQDILKNIFGGILIIFDQPFQVGDKINVGGTYGEVVSIGLRSTRIVTPDDNLVSVPNAQVVDGQVSNANAGALDCQVVTDLYLPGWVDVMKAKAIAYNAAAMSKYVFLDKPIVVIVKDEFRETFLTHLMVKAYVLDTRYESVFLSDVTETAKAEFLRQNMLWPMAGQRDDFSPPSSPPEAS